MLSNALLKSVYTASIDQPDLKPHCDEEIKLLVFRKSTTFLRTRFHKLAKYVS